MTATKPYPNVLIHQDPTFVPVTSKTMFGMEAFASVKYCVNFLVP